ADARVIISLDTFDPEVDLVLHGVSTLERKLKALDLLTEHRVTTTILPAISAGLNDADLPQLLDLVLERENIVSLEAHTMCFTGQGGAAFDRASRITVPDLHRIIEAHTGGQITGADFVPSPLAHPLCYSICYLLMLDGDDGRYLPLVRLMGRAGLYELLGESLYIEPRDRLEQVFLEIIDRLWAEPDELAASERVLATLKRLINDMFPSGPVLSINERRRIAERTVKAIYIHAHMDEESFDVSRVVKCCVGVPQADGSTIPTCSYNVLYRARDPRFGRVPGQPGGGRR
ncbi:MAG: hypothetical protein GY842_14580, partial [bacterium]|nr:hypothetical protein [bacterium]